MTDTERIDRLEKLVAMLLNVSFENEDFWPYTDKEKQKVAIEFYESMKESDAEER